MSNRHHWQAWVELPQSASAELKAALRLVCEALGRNYDPAGNDIVVCEGGHAKCLAYRKAHRTIAGLETHIGYTLED